MHIFISVSIKKYIPNKHFSFSYSFFHLIPNKIFSLFLLSFPFSSFFLFIFSLYSYYFLRTKCTVCYLVLGSSWSKKSIVNPLLSSMWFIYKTSYNMFLKIVLAKKSVINIPKTQIVFKFSDHINYFSNQIIYFNEVIWWRI